MATCGRITAPSAVTFPSMPPALSNTARRNGCGCVTLRSRYAAVSQPLRKVAAVNAHQVRC
eukprot:COSAG02_NODE_840_length_16627_cov_11.279828_11_plen_61_part_00